jgi:FkbM family methyltransferase
MKTIKAALLRLLGQRRYLAITSSAFFLALSKGWLRRNPLYDTHYFVGQLIAPGHTVLDIGANLGYYTRPFAQRVGSTGSVLAVEPIALYRQVLQRNTKHLPQVRILPVALGQQPGNLQMGNPGPLNHRHGLMRVLTPAEAQNTPTYTVEVAHPLQVFGQIDRIDYIKCDIEGYEVPVIPTMAPLIAKHKPIVQIEVEQKNLTVIFELLTGLGYQLFYVNGHQLQSFFDPGQHLPADLIGIPPAKLTALRHHIIHHE